MQLKVQYQFFLLIRSAWCIGLLLMASTGLKAQQSSQKGWIDADFNLGCQGLTVTITHTGVNTDDFQFNFEGDPNDPFSRDFPATPTGNSGRISIGQTRTFTYNTPGNYIIRVVDQSSRPNPDRFDLLAITVLDQVSPVVASNTCANNQVQLTFDFTSDPFTSFNIDYGDGSPIQNFIKNPTLNSDAISHTYATNGNYPVTVTGILAAGGNSSSCSTSSFNIITQQTIETPVLNSISLADETSIAFTYNRLETGTLYFLEIDRGSGFEAFADLNPTTNPTNITIQDSSIDNTSNFYLFRIRARDICLSTQVTSQTGSTIQSSFSLNTIDTTIDLDYDWATSAVNFAQIDFFVDNSLNASFNLAESATPHAVSYTNCEQLLPFFFQTVINGIVSTSLVLTPFENSTLLLPAPSSPVAELIGGRITLSLPSTNFLVSEYQILRRDITSTFNQLATSTSVTFVDTTIPQNTEEVCYQIRYLDQCGNTSNLSTEVCIIIESKLGIPNAFSPNGDGMNDLFTVTEGIYNNFQMLIYNRWGTLVYQTNDPILGWNGTYEGADAPTGSYSYRITFQNVDSSITNRSGTFVLIR